MLTTVRTERNPPLVTVTIDRPDRRNAVDAATAAALAQAFRAFEADDDLAVAILTGAGGTFCAGADLHEIASGARGRVVPGGDAPMGPTGFVTTKPVIAAIEGHAVAGGLELALWCDLRVAAADAVLGVFSRRFGVPLIDGGTVRLPRIVGLGRALDLILTGRPVGAPEAHAIGLVDRVTAAGAALEGALELARLIAARPQAALRADRAAALEAFAPAMAEAMERELRGGLDALLTGEAEAGAARFAGGAGRHGRQSHPFPQ